MKYVLSYAANGNIFKESVSQLNAPSKTMLLCEQTGNSFDPTNMNYAEYEGYLMTMVQIFGMRANLRAATRRRAAAT